jgi:Tol biopolymer transport system component
MLKVGAAVAAAVLALPAAAARAEVPGNAGSFTAAISGNGRFVAFDSEASNLVPEDRNGRMDVFVRDIATSNTQRVSVGPGRIEANDQSSDPAISADGYHVAFTSWATNLSPGDTNGESDVFSYDVVTQTTELVSVGLDGEPGDDLSTDPSVSADGRYVAFTSYASNLVPGDTAGTWDVFVRDRETGTTERVDVSSEGIPAPAGRRIYSRATISADGRYVSFSSDASGLVAGDTNGTADVFVRDRVAWTTERVSVGNDGRQLDPDNGIYGAAISADGRYVTFISGSDGIFVRDRVTGTTKRVDVATDGADANGSTCCGQAISDDGRYVVFMSAAGNLVTGDTNDSLDVFVHDRATGATERVSVGDKQQANEASSVAGITSHGTLVAFQSNASNLVAGDTNDASDIFLRDRELRRTDLVSAIPKPRFSFGKTTMTPRPPRAGRFYTVTMPIAVDGQPVAAAKVTAKAIVRHRTVPLVRRSFASSTARVVWRIPKSARNRYLTATITVRTAGGAVASTFSAIVR